MALKFEIEMNYFILRTSQNKHNKSNNTIHMYICHTVLELEAVKSSHAHLCILE